MSTTDPTLANDGGPAAATAIERATLLGIDAVERGLVPDALVRRAIRRLCAQRLAHETAGSCDERLQRKLAFIETMDRGPIAPVPEAANEQHYELPAAFFDAVLGHRGKYSGCHFASPGTGLDAAEDASLAATCAHAELDEGQRILELGCGWGALTLWMATTYRSSEITAVSNSHSQRAHIEARAAERGLTNVRVITADMNDFAPDRAPFDRVVSVEMFEHMRNWRELLRRVSEWLRPGGKLLIHVFCHREMAYEFQAGGATDWMGRNFFTGGIMPSDDLALHFQEHLRADAQWRWNGLHYAATANAWLANLDRERTRLLPLLEEAHGRDAEHWHQRWRMFFMACAELFGFDRGEQWWVTHHRMVRPDDT